MPPTVSVNLCCHNSERYLSETLESILNQTYTDWELVIINDGSTDRTESIITEYTPRIPHLTYHSQPNRGLAHSRNEAVARSRGSLIAFIDHDDVWLPQKLERQTTLFDQAPRTDLVYSNFLLKDETTGRTRRAHRRRQPSGRVYGQFLQRYPVGLSTVVVQRRSLERLDQLFDPRLRLSEEFDVFMRILHWGVAGYTREPLAVYRIHTRMASLQHIALFAEEATYVTRKLVGLHEEDAVTYHKALKRRSAHLDYAAGKVFLAQGQLLAARERLVAHRLSNWKYALAYAATFLPLRLWLSIEPLWRRGLFRRVDT